jgi:hypothetical protein
MYRKMVSGLDSPVVGDTSSQTISLTVNTAGDIELATFAAGDTIDNIYVGGVPLLIEPVSFDTSKAVTIAAIVAQINSPQNRTAPAYRAIDDSGNDKVLIRQIVPAEGTVEVTVDASGSSPPVVTPTNLTGASLGQIQDSIVRAFGAFGAYLPAAASASSGWADPT